MFDVCVGGCHCFGCGHVCDSGLILTLMSVMMIMHVVDDDVDDDCVDSEYDAHDDDDECHEYVHGVCCC